MISFLKKNATTIILLCFLALWFIPQTGMPIKVFFNGLFAFSPSEIAAEKQTKVNNYSWQLYSLAGEAVNFNDAENTVAVVNIWATWCPPCVAEMPSMQALYDAYGDRVAFYFISLEDAATIERFMVKKGYSVPAYTTQNVFPAALETGSFPTTYVISKSGNIVINKKGAANWNSDSVHATLDALLAE